MHNIRCKLAKVLENLAHWLRYSTTTHTPLPVFSWQLVLITEDPFGDVHEVLTCAGCRVNYPGKHLGNTLIEQHDGVDVYVGAFKANRMQRFLAMGNYTLA